MKVNENKIELCSTGQSEESVRPFILVIFGGAGDLAKRKLLPTLFDLYRKGKLPGKFTVIGFGRQNMDDNSYRILVGDLLGTFGSDNKTIADFLQHLKFAFGNFEDVVSYDMLRERVESVDSGQEIFYYLSVPGAIYGDITRKIGESGLDRSGRVRLILEKPFGNDLSTAIDLNRLIHQTFGESQIFRMDHYLGKETVQNILFFRFSNSIFEPMWNRLYIDNVQITVAEDIGIEHRGNFYEKTGIIRDMVQNHILQLIALVAMEPPPTLDSEAIRDEKVKVFRSFRPMDEAAILESTVTGQYGSGSIEGENVPAYRDEMNVDSKSNVPTFFAARFCIDNWRWAGVPFFVRTGKRLARKLTEIVIQFRQPPLRLFQENCRPLRANNLKLTIQPKEEIQLHFGVKYPESRNMIYPVDMDFCYCDYFGNPSLPPYERLVNDALSGDQSLFVRQDGVEAMWEFVDPLIRTWEKREPLIYPAGSSGPTKSDELLKGENREWLSM